MAVRTLTTSNHVVSRRGDTNQAPTDWIKENTDFDEIFYQGSEYFFSNDLEHERGYKNSHFTPESLKRGYPYLSTIVWPIYGPGEDGDDGGWKVLAFLCVDSAESNTFDEGMDVAVGLTCGALVVYGFSELGRVSFAWEDDRNWMPRS